jgi:hypothetical protein
LSDSGTVTLIAESDFIRGDGLISRPMGRMKSVNPDCDIFREQHTPLRVDEVC